MPDSLEVLEITGHVFKRILENSVGDWPKYVGRWPCVSGVKFKFDSRKPKGERIVEMLKENGEIIEMDKYYTIAMDSYIAKGRDGYDAVLDPSVKNI